jgi:hypothetical protein
MLDLAGFVLSALETQFRAMQRKMLVPFGRGQDSSKYKTIEAERMEKRMLKKIVLGTLFIGLIGVLVAGAVIRTMDRTERVAEAQGYGHGHDEVGECEEGESGQGRGGYGGQGREDTPGGQMGTGQANVEGWLTLQGAIVSVDPDTLVVQTDSGQQVAVENRAWWFAQEQGFSAQVGDQVTLIGFYEGDHFEVGRIDNATNGQTVRLRDENGRPLWARRGRRGG